MNSRLVLLLSAVLVACGLVSAPAANAQQRNLVIFGDSIIADTPTFEYLGNRLSSGSSGSSGSSQVPGSSGAGSSDGRVCPTSTNNYGIRAAAKLGLAAWDYSCAGATSISNGPQFSAQVERALGDGALTPATSRVIITTGFNDTYNNNNLAEWDVRQRFVDAMAPQVQRIRSAAPNARIQIVGYASITDHNHICLFHLGANIHDRTPAPQVGYWENLAQGMQWDLARATGVEFLDLKPSTQDKSMCAPDSTRIWSGLFDFHAGPGNMPVHLVDRGHEHVANVIAAS